MIWMALNRIHQRCSANVGGGGFLALATVLAMLLFSACARHDVPDAVAVPGPVQPINAPDHTDPAARAERCEEQAARFVARGLWRESSTTATDERLLRSKAHYSQKHGECDVLVEGRLTLTIGVEIVYSKLWDVYAATPLAAWTNDPRTAVRRGVCQVDLSDDPFVSCRVAKFFIDDHMGH